MGRKFLCLILSFLSLANVSGDSEGCNCTVHQKRSDSPNILVPSAEHNGFVDADYYSLSACAPFKNNMISGDTDGLSDMAHNFLLHGGGNTSMSKEEQEARITWWLETGMPYIKCGYRKSRGFRGGSPWIYSGKHCISTPTARLVLNYNLKPEHILCSQTLYTSRHELARCHNNENTGEKVCQESRLNLFQWFDFQMSGYGEYGSDDQVCFGIVKKKLLQFFASKHGGYLTEEELTAIDCEAVTKGWLEKNNLTENFTPFTMPVSN